MRGVGKDVGGDAIGGLVGFLVGTIGLVGKKLPGGMGALVEGAFDGGLEG